MALGQFQNVSVRILDESIDISAAGPIGRGSADEFNAFRFELITIRRRCVNKSYLPLVAGMSCVYPPGGESPENLQQGGRRHDRAINTTDVISDTVASYAITNEQGATKNGLDNRQ
jgi:hypothetical protein